MDEFTHDVIIGVDGGGTGCRVGVGTVEKGVLAKVHGGSANVTTDINLAIKNIVAAINRAATEARVTPCELSASTVHLGLAGAICATQISQIAQALPYGRVTVTDDRATTLVGAFADQTGYLLAVGTGTIVATNAGGPVRSVGGWGLQVSDQGSGAWLGRAALEHVLLCYDGLADWSDFSTTLFAQYDDDPNAVVRFATRAKPTDYGAFAPAIVTAARDGDVWARSALQRGADYMARGLVRLGFAPGDRLCLVGGLGPHYAAYLSPEFLTGHTAAKGNALDGAYALACDARMKQNGGQV
jgi:glucosamine kinase